MKAIKEFTTHNDNENLNCGGTSLVGQIHGTYANLKKHFGQPTESDGYKSDAEWVIQFKNGHIATIYNWKDGKNYNGKDGLPKTKIVDWHVGGRTDEVIKMIEAILK